MLLNALSFGPRSSCNDSIGGRSTFGIYLPTQTPGARILQWWPSANLQFVVAGKLLGSGKSNLIQTA